MATITDQYVLQAEGSGDLEKIKAAMDELYRSFHLGKIGADEYVASMGRLDAAAARLGGAGSQAATATHTLNAGMAGIQQSSKSGAQGLLMLSQVIDDAQYGFRAIVNNIPTLAMAMGQGMGMSAEAAMKFGGAMGILAVAINQNLKHLDDWKALGTDILGGLGLDENKVASLADSFWQLAGALNGVVETVSGGTISFSMEQMRLDAEQKEKEARAAKEGRTGFDQAEKDVDKGTKDRAAAFGKAVEGTEGGGKAIRDELFKRLKTAGGYTEKDLDKEVKLQSGGTTTRRKQLEEEAGRIYGRARAGGEGEILQIGEMEGAGFQARLNEAMPEGKEREKKREEESKRRKDEAEKEAKDKQKEDERRKKEEDADYQQAIRMIAAEEEQKTKGYASSLQGRFNRARVAGQGVSETGVAEELERTQGLDADQAAKYAEGVKTQLEKGFNESIRKGAGERGTTTDEELSRLKVSDSREQMLARLGIADANLGVLSAQANLREKFLGGAPERYNIADFARQAEAKGSDPMKDQLEVLRAMQAVDKAILDANERQARALEKGQAARFG